MESLDEVFRQNEGAERTRSIISNKNNWPAEAVEDDVPVVNGGGALNSTEDAMIAKIDAENAEKREKGSEHQTN